MTDSKKKLLFVCIENSNRSQMSQAFAKILAGDMVESHSAGSRPSGKVNPKAIASMGELGYDLSAHASKSLQEIPDIEYDAVITMGCGDACPMARTRLREDWQIPDPREMDPDQFRQVRDLIRGKVASLLAHLGMGP